MLASPQQSARVHGHGVQPWSAGEFYPWHCVIVDNAVTGLGRVYYAHPDGRRTGFTTYGRSATLRQAVEQADDNLVSYLGATLRMY